MTYPSAAAFNWGQSNMLEVKVDSSDSAPVTPIDQKTMDQPFVAQVKVTKPVQKTAELVAAADATAATPSVGLVRFRVPKKSECFIAPGPATYRGMIDLIKTSCPSLAEWPADKLTLHITFDPTLETNSGVKFRITPECWPAAITDALKLVTVSKIHDEETKAIESAQAIKVNRDKALLTEEMPETLGRRPHWVLSAEGVEYETSATEGSTPRQPKAFEAMSDRERRAFTEEMPSTLGRRPHWAPPVNVGSDTMERMRALSVAEGAQVAQRGAVDNSWVDLVKRGVALGE